MDKPELLPCPFCGGMPRIDLAKKEHCQLHGDPSQAVKVYCYHHCPSRPAVVAGDVYNGGEAQARSEAITRWNTRTDRANELAAAAYEAARKVIFDDVSCAPSWFVDRFDQLCDLTPADAVAALAARDARIREAALDAVLKEVEGYLPEFGAGEPQDGTDRIIDQCWRDFRKVVLALIAKDKANG